jgi:hypothetical protein
VIVAPGAKGSFPSSSEDATKLTTIIPLSNPHTRTTGFQGTRMCMAEPPETKSGPRFNPLRTQHRSIFSFCSLSTRESFRCRPGGRSLFASGLASRENWPTRAVSQIAIVRQPSFTLDGIILCMVSIAQIPTRNVLKRIQRIQTITIAWMTVEPLCRSGLGFTPFYQTCHHFLRLTRPINL